MKKCDSKSSDGCSQLGYLYETGKGVKVNEAKVVISYIKACNYNDFVRCLDLGVIYSVGLHGEARNSELSESYFKKSCLSKKAVGCMFLAYEMTKQKRIKEAVKYYSLACEKEEKGACVRKKLYTNSLLRLPK